MEEGYGSDSDIRLVEEIFGPTVGEEKQVLPPLQGKKAEAVVLRDLDTRLATTDITSNEESRRIYG